MNCAMCDNCPFVGYTGKVVYEVHITVPYSKLTLRWASINNIKLIHIDMGDGAPTQLMTSVVTEDYERTVDTLLNLCERYSVPVERVKVETTPNNKAHKVLYREAHFASTGGSFNHEDYKLHKSRNLLKKDTGNVQMYTYRSEQKECYFNKTVDVIKKAVPNLHKVIVESCILDTNREMDNAWLKI